MEEIKTKKCSKCGRELPLNGDYFEKRLEGKDGFRNVCRECKGRTFKIKVENPSSKKKCKICKQWFDINEENFPKSSRTVDGFMGVCHKCHKEKYHKESSEDGHKICKKCNRQLPKNEEYFMEDKLCLDGYRNICRECSGSNFGKRREMNKWTNEEDIILMGNYPYMSNKDIVKNFMPYRKPSQIQNYATKILGLKKDKQYMKERSWTEEMDNYLIENYPNTDNKILSEYLGKNEKTIVARAVKLNLHKDNFFWTEEEIQILKDNFPFMKNKELWEKYFNHRDFHAVINKANDMGLSKDRVYLQKMRSIVGKLNLKNIHGLKGKLHPLYKERVKIECEYCGKDIFRLESDIINNKNTFCSRDCRARWVSENLSGENSPIYGRMSEMWTEEMRRNKAESQIKILKESDFSYRKTKPQLVIDNLLDNLNIAYENEYDCKYYLIDNYLTEYNLMIEVIL